MEIKKINKKAIACFFITTAVFSSSTLFFNSNLGQKFFEPVEVRACFFDSIFDSIVDSVTETANWDLYMSDIMQESKN